MDFILEESKNIAAAAPAYVRDGPTVQYDAHAKDKYESLANVWRQGTVKGKHTPSNGPIARPS